MSYGGEQDVFDVIGGGLALVAGCAAVTAFGVGTVYGVAKLTEGPHLARSQPYQPTTTEETAAQCVDVTQSGDTLKLLADTHKLQVAKQAGSTVCQQGIYSLQVVPRG